MEAGVIFLTGTALTAAEGDLAESLARRMPGVLYGDNQIAVETSLRIRLRPVLGNLQDQALNGLALAPASGRRPRGPFLPFPRPDPLPVERSSNAWGPNLFLSDLLRQIAAAGVALLGLIPALQLLDAAALVGAVLGAAGVAGIAVGFAFRNIAENYLAGIILSIRQPFFPNDQVLVEGQEGKVLRLTSRETVLMTLDGNHVRIPNATIFNSVVTNYTRNPLRRFKFDLSVGQGEDLARVQEIAIATLSAMDGILNDPPPRTSIVEVGDSWVLLRFFGWVNQNQVAFEKARSEAIRLTMQALVHEGVTMPAPEYGLRFLNPLEQIEGGPGAASSSGGLRQGVLSTHGVREPSEGPLSPPGLTRAADISPDLELEAQIEKDREEAKEKDLLDPGS